jgi:hypothetical protein
VLASSPEAVRRFAVANPASAANGPVAEIPFLRLSLQDLRKFLKDRQDVLAAQIVEKDQITREEAVKQLQGLAAALQPFDRLELRERCGPDQLSWIVRIRTAQPLRK